MLKLSISEKEIFNENTNEFTTIKPCTICLEHSLVSISKWESKWHKPFLSTTQDEKTDKELRDYIRCMTITQNVNSEIYDSLSESEIKSINDYIGDSMTATTFTNNRNADSCKKEIYTSELIYYWMVAYQIPFVCETWHLNRLLTLIRICSIKNANGKENKMSAKATMESNKALNAARRSAYHTKG
jgi:cytochrome c553